MTRLFTPALTRGRLPIWAAPLAYLLSILVLVAITLASVKLGLPLSLGAPLQTLAFVAIALLVPRLLTGSVRRDDFGLARADWGRQAVITLLMLVLITVIVSLWETRTPGAEEASGQVIESFGLGKGIGSDALMILAITFCAPVAEEMIFRAMLYRGLRDGAARWLPLWATVPLAALISAALFADTHGGDGQDKQLVMLFVMGLFFALAYEWSGTLSVPVMVHAINNAMALGFGLSAAGVTLSAPWLWALVPLGPVLALTLMLWLRRILP